MQELLQAFENESSITETRLRKILRFDFDADDNTSILSVLLTNYFTMEEKSHAIYTLPYFTPIEKAKIREAGLDALWLAKSLSFGLQVCIENRTKAEIDKAIEIVLNSYNKRATAKFCLAITTPLTMALFATMIVLHNDITMLAVCTFFFVLSMAGFVVGLNGLGE